MFCGGAISQTGGHGDLRGPGETHLHEACGGAPHVVDGVDAVRKAVREELRKGAHHIKVMASGGVASPTDRIDSTQFSMEELTVAVDEARAANRYVAAHTYTAHAVERALQAGVRSIEHGNLIDEGTIAHFHEHDAFLVVNLVTYWAMQREGREWGMPAHWWKKVEEVLDSGFHALALAHAGGVRIAYGTDLLGEMQSHQNQEFALRADVQPAIDIIRSATTVGAELLNRSGEIGVVAPGAYGDLIVLERDPVEDVRVLADPEKFSYVIQGGHIAVAS